MPRGSLDDRTRAAYASDWRHFASWVEEHGADPLPATPELLVAYLLEVAPGSSRSTVARRLAAISGAHVDAGLASPVHHPEVRAVWSELRTQGAVRVGSARPPLDPALVRAAVLALPDDAAGARDRALLLLGFAGSLRPGDLVGLDLEEVRRRRDAVDLATFGAVGRGRGPTCPVRALDAWLATRGRRAGALFPSLPLGPRPRRLRPSSVTRILKRALERCGADPSAYSAESLRAGHLAAAERLGLRHPTPVDLGL